MLFSLAALCLLVYVQIRDLAELEDINHVLGQLNFLEVAGISQSLYRIEDRDALLTYCSHWLCLGRTRSALER